MPSQLTIAMMAEEDDMSETLLGTILSAVIAGVFSLIAKRMELSQQQDHASTFVYPSAGSVATAVGSLFNYGIVVRHIGILQLLVNLAGFLVGFVMGMTGASMATMLLTIIVVGVIVLSAGFFWSALAVEKAGRWKHLSIVAMGVSLTTLIVNAIALQAQPAPIAYIVAFAHTFVSMGIGGSIANTIKQ
jgi:hypothetical protein